MSHESTTPTGLRERPTRIHWIALAILTVGSILVRVWLNQRIEAPTILTDELTYSQLAENIANGSFSLSTGYGLVYPLLLAPAWALADFGTTAYIYMQTTNAIIVSLVAIPVFLWAKRMMRPWYALLAAALTLAMPSMAYSGMIMTDNAFLTVFVLACFAIAVAAERPTILNQAFVVAALLLAMGTRAQAVVLFAALPIIFLLTILMEERATNSFSLAGLGRRALRFWPLATLAGIGLVVVVARTALTSWKLNDVLQAYSGVTAGQYTASTIARFTVWHAGEFIFAVGVIPAVALLVLAGLAILNRTRTSAERSYVATALVVVPLTVLQVAVFTSWFSLRVSERNMFCMFPIVLIGFALWLDSTTPRPRRTAILAAAVAGFLVLAVPFAYLYGLSPSTETWSLVLPELLTRKFPGGSNDVQILIVAGVAITLTLFGILRPRLAVLLLPLIVAGYFFVSEAAVVHTVGKAATNYRNVPSLGQDASWLDRYIPPGSPVAFLVGTSLGADADRLITWETGFFNRTLFETATWGTDLVADPLTGNVTAPGGAPLSLPEYVITPSSFRLQGDVVADRGAFLLVNPLVPYRLQSQSSGIYPDGWTAPAAAINYYSVVADRTVRVQLDLAGTPQGVPSTTATVIAGTLALDSGGGTVIKRESDRRSIVISATEGADFELAVPSAPFRIEMAFEPGFRRSDFGQDDQRELGSHVKIMLGDQVISG